MRRKSSNNRSTKDAPAFIGLALAAPGRATANSPLMISMSSLSPVIELTYAGTAARSTRGSRIGRFNSAATAANKASAYHIDK